MASVRLSRQLRSEIRNNAVEAFQRTNPTPEYTSAQVNFIIDAIQNSPTQKKYDEIVALYSEVPQYQHRGSYTTDEGHAFGFTPPRKNSHTKVRFYDVGNTSTIVELGRRMVCYGSGRDWALNVPMNVIEDPADREKIREILRDFEQRKTDHENTYKNYDANISNLLNNCSTLKQFLDAWPAGETFVPNEAVAEMHTKVTRIQKARAIKEKVEFDDSSVNQVVLTSKLMGS